MMTSRFRTSAGFWKPLAMALALMAAGLSWPSPQAGTLQAREVRVVNASAGAGQNVNVSIELVSLGNENALGFSLNFDTTIFSNPVASLGTGANGATLNVNTIQAANGRIGVAMALPSGQSFPAGVRQIAVVTFNVAANAAAGPSSLTFGDQPIAREISDPNANVLMATYTAGTITIVPANPTPQLTSLNPASAMTGSGNLTLTLNGTGFIPLSSVRWNNAARSTMFVNGSQLTASIPASDFAQAGMVSVTVVNPAPGGGTSNALTFNVINSVASVSAASFLGAELAPESIVAAFGVNLATSIEIANTVPLPTMLAGTKLAVKDSAGVERLSPLFFVAPGQINYLIPSGTVNGAASVTVTSGDNKISVGTVQIASVAPGLFSANSNGQGVPAATIFRLKPNGESVIEALARFDSATNRFVPIPIDLGPETEQVFVVLFGTGFRFNGGLSGVSAQIGGLNSEVLFAGPQGDFVGLDQSNVRISRVLIGRGEVDLNLTVNGKVTNTVRINIK